MKSNIHFKIAGFLNLGTALLHTFAGQATLINPLVNSNILAQVKGELVSAWHIVTFFLFATSIVLLRVGFSKIETTQIDLLKFIGWMYVSTFLPFVASSIWFSIFAPQWILLMPIGIFTLLGLKKR